MRTYENIFTVNKLGGIDWKEGYEMLHETWILGRHWEVRTLLDNQEIDQHEFNAYDTALGIIGSGYFNNI